MSTISDFLFCWLGSLSFQFRFLILRILFYSWFSWSFIIKKVFLCFNKFIYSNFKTFSTFQMMFLFGCLFANISGNLFSSTCKRNGKIFGWFWGFDFLNYLLVGHFYQILNVFFFSKTIFSILLHDISETICKFLRLWLLNLNDIRIKFF